MARRRVGAIGPGLPAGPLPASNHFGGWPVHLGGVPRFDSTVYAPPPPGTFDPGITAKVRQGRRGLQDLLEDEWRKSHQENTDTEQALREGKRGLARSQSDLARQRGYAQTDYASKVGDLGINFARDIADLGTARLRGGEDYERTLTDMQHRYGSLAEQQLQASIEGGTGGDSGTQAASAAVRGANQRYDKAGVDLNQQRSTQDLDTREAREREDYARSLGRAGEGLAREETGFDVSGQRDRQDFRTSRNHLETARTRAEAEHALRESRGKRDQTAFELDSGEQAYFQAHQLHPKIQFPGSQPPAGSAGAAGPGGMAPHVYGNVIAPPPGSGPGRTTHLGATHTAAAAFNAGGAWGRRRAPAY